MLAKSSPEKLMIELRAEDVAQLYDMLDPYPFPERDLGPEVDTFIVGWVREKRYRGPIEIVVHLPAGECDKAAARQFAGAVRRHYTRRADAMTGEITELFRNGRRFLLIGVVVLLFCVILSQNVKGWLGAGGVSNFVAESALILGWVANWRPIEIFLYDWWPLKRRRTLFQRLASADVRLQAEPKRNDTGA